MWPITRSSRINISMTIRTKVELFAATLNGGSVRTTSELSMFILWNLGAN